MLMVVFFFPFQNLEALCRHVGVCRIVFHVWLHLEAKECTIGNYKKSFQKDLKRHAGEYMEISHL